MTQDTGHRTQDTGHRTQDELYQENVKTALELMVLSYDPGWDYSTVFQLVCEATVELLDVTYHLTNCEDADNKDCRRFRSKIGTIIALLREANSALKSLEI